MTDTKPTWVAWNIEAECNPTNHQAISDLAAEMSSYFHSNESGTTHFEWSTAADRSKVVLHERYADSEAALSHIMAFGERFAERFMALVVLKRVVVSGYPTPALQETLAGMSPEVLTTFAGFSRSR